LVVRTVALGPPPVALEETDAASVAAADEPPRVRGASVIVPILVAQAAWMAALGYVVTHLVF
jgi:hypothetical protein